MLTNLILITTLCYTYYYHHHFTDLLSPYYVPTTGAGAGYPMLSETKSLNLEDLQWREGHRRLRPCSVEHV